MGIKYQQGYSLYMEDLSRMHTLKDRVSTISS